MQIISDLPFCKNFILNDHELFLNLLPHEQEVVYAGISVSEFPFFLQVRKEMSFTKNKLNISEDGKNLSITQEAVSMYWELSIGINPS